MSVKPGVKTLSTLLSTSSLSTLYKSTFSAPYPASNQINSRIVLLQGDITKLAVDAIVNAANPSLLGGGGVDGAIHTAAGYQLVGECSRLNGCDYGSAKITGGYRLPAGKIIHAVGPDTRRFDPATSKQLLESAYSTSLSLLKEHNLKSIAFPCISTGIYGYDNSEAAHVALRVVREFIQKKENKDIVVIFCCYLEKDLEIYREVVKKYFPPALEDKAHFGYAVSSIIEAAEDAEKEEATQPEDSQASQAEEQPSQTWSGDESEGEGFVHLKKKGKFE